MLKKQMSIIVISVPSFKTDKTNNMKEINITQYHVLIENIGFSLEKGRNNVAKSINNELLLTKWEIGKHIIEFEQHGNEKAEYGSSLLNELANDLKMRYGKGFSRRSVLDMRRFYVFFPIWQTVSAKLSWSHYVELIGMKDDLERSFYEKQCIRENWGVRELQRQKNSSLFQRLALSKNKNKILALSEQGQIIENGQDLIKDPYVLEFLNIPENHAISEKDLEQKIIDNLQQFLLELGKGFAFIGRQYRITLNNTHYYIDLVFYHRLLRCFVLIDLKTKKIDHADIGQMSMYLGYFKKEEMVEGENQPIGIILSKERDEILVEYATVDMTKNLFVSEYQLYLPDKKELEKRLNRILNE
jgi:predicted nuclease of restriction endonuclease-like (RecB) superfamily